MNKISKFSSEMNTIQMILTQKEQILAITNLYTEPVNMAENYLDAIFRMFKFYQTQITPETIVEYFEGWTPTYKNNKIHYIYNETEKFLIKFIKGKGKKTIYFTINDEGRYKLETIDDLINNCYPHNLLFITKPEITEKYFPHKTSWAQIL